MSGLFSDATDRILSCCCCSAPSKAISRTLGSFHDMVKAEEELLLLLLALWEDFQFGVDGRWNLRIEEGTAPSVSILCFLDSFSLTPAAGKHFAVARTAAVLWSKLFFSVLIQVGVKDLGACNNNNGRGAQYFSHSSK